MIEIFNLFNYKCQKIYILWSRWIFIVCSVVQFCQHPPAQPTHQCQHKSSLSGNNWRRQLLNYDGPLYIAVVTFIKLLYFQFVCFSGSGQWPVDCGRCRKWSQFANFFLQKLSSHPQQISGLIVVWGCGLWRGASFIVILLRQKQSRKNWPPEKCWSHLTSSAASSSRPQFLYCLGHNDKNILIFQ